MNKKQVGVFFVCVFSVAFCGAMDCSWVRDLHEVRTIKSDKSIKVYKSGSFIDSGIESIMISKKSISIACESYESIAGILVADKIDINVKRFRFTGTIICNGLCTINSKEIDPSSFIRMGSGRFRINGKTYWATHTLHEKLQLSYKMLKLLFYERYANLQFKKKKKKRSL